MTVALRAEKALVRRKAARPAAPAEPITKAESDCGEIDGALRAHRLRLAGFRWDQVAAKSGYASGRVAQMAVTAYLQRAGIALAQEERRAELCLELERLDELMRLLWPRAADGELKAVDTILKIIDRRTRLLGLDDVSLRDGNTANTIVISSENMADELRQYAESSGRAVPTRK